MLSFSSFSWQASSSRVCSPLNILTILSSPKTVAGSYGGDFFGLFLGILALRSRSIWGGVTVHTGVALSMDIAALLQKGTLPICWLPL